MGSSVIRELSQKTSVISQTMDNRRYGHHGLYGRYGQGLARQTVWNTGFSLVFRNSANAKLKFDASVKSGPREKRVLRTLNLQSRKCPNSTFYGRVKFGLQTQTEISMDALVGLSTVADRTSLTQTWTG
jgi:hypothetical protein